MAGAVQAGWDGQSHPIVTHESAHLLFHKHLTVKDSRPWPLRLSQPSADSCTVSSILVTESLLQEVFVSYDDRLR